MTPTIDQNIPLFRIFDVEKAKEFSCGSPLRPGLEDTGHGSCGLGVIDPFGNHIRFDEAKSAPEPSRE